MSKNTDFQARIARLEAKAASAPVRHDPPEQTVQRPLLRAKPVMPAINIVLGLSLLAGVLVYLWDDVSVFLPQYEDGRRVSYLEAALRDSMTEEERERMNADPDLQGMTQLQKMIMSH